MEQYKDKIQQIEICSFEISCKDTRYLISSGKCYFEVNTAIVNLIAVLQQANTLQEVVILFGKKQNKIYTEGEVELLIKQYIDPIINRVGKSHSSFLIKKEILSENSINIFSDFLKILLKKEIILLFLGIVCCLEFLFFSNHLSLVTSHRFNLYTLVELLLLFVISSFIHELGHASACRYFKVRHGGIGFGLYLNFPVFYTDVSNIWKLSRKRRLVVNFSGVYFQLILLIPILLLYFYTNSILLKYFIYVVNLNFLITLNPFFKFDGYWIISDLLGVPNLRQRTMEVFSYYLKKIKNKRIKKKPFLFGMKKREKFFMSIYSLVVNFFFAYYFLYLLPLFLYDFIKTFPIHIQKIVLELVAGKIPDYQLTQIVVVKLLFFIFTIYLLFKMILGVVYKFKRIRY